MELRGASPWHHPHLEADPLNRATFLSVFWREQESRPRQAHAHPIEDSPVVPPQSPWCLALLACSTGDAAAVSRKSHRTNCQPDSHVHKRRNQAPLPLLRIC